MTAIILWIHVSAAISGFILTGIISYVVLRGVHQSEFSPTFWRWQRVAQWVTVVLGASGVTLYLSGKRPQDPLHLLYGALALFAIILLAGFGPDRDPRDLLQGWKVNPQWILFGVNVFLWAMYGRGLTTGFFGF
jgi:hypothetical protein